MPPLEFVMHARVHKFTAGQVQAQFPDLPLQLCAALLTGVAFICRINSNGTVIVDDGQP